MLLSSSTISTFTGVFAQHFDLFSTESTIRVYKEPIKTFADTGVSVYAGYGNASAETNMTYTPVYQDFPAIVRYQKEQPIQEFSETRSQISDGKCFIKVKSDCRDYILNGKTQAVDVNGKTFNVISDDGVQNYFGLLYYRFVLLTTT